MHLNRVVGDSDTRPAALTAHLPTSCTSRQTGRNGTYTAGRFHCRKHSTSCILHHRMASELTAPLTDRPMPSINKHTITPITHTTRGEVGAYKEGGPPLSRSLFIERSERFPHCLLEIPLATPWPKQTLRLANRTYSPHNNYLPIPRRLQPIYYSYVCAIDSTAPPISLGHQSSLAPPPTNLWPRSHYNR